MTEAALFAWIVGTLELLNVSERNRVKGIVFNKFRGDKSILKPGLDMLESRINKPVLGVIPYMHNLGIDDEDSVSLEFNNKFTQYRAENLPFSLPCEGGEIGVVIKSKMPHLILSNYMATILTSQETVSCRHRCNQTTPYIKFLTDFNIFTHEKDVRVRFIDKASDIGKPDLLVIPGTKNTIEDLIYIRERGISGEITNLARYGTMIIGICGGYQMLGMQINDPHHVESSKDSTHGLGLLNTGNHFCERKADLSSKCLYAGTQ